MLRFSLLRKPKNSLGYELLSAKWKVVYRSGLPLFLSGYNLLMKDLEKEAFESLFFLPHLENLLLL